VSGYVYIARREDGIIKIGSSRRPGARLAGLVQQSGQRVTLVFRAFVAEPLAVERALQAMCSDRLTKGREWFDLSDDRVGTLVDELERRAIPDAEPAPDRRMLKGFGCGAPMADILEKASALMSKATGRNVAEGAIIRDAILRHVVEDALADAPKMLEARIAELTPRQRETGGEDAIRAEYDLKLDELLRMCEHYGIAVDVPKAKQRMR
jgi:hypothetical protein